MLHWGQAHFLTPHHNNYRVLIWSCFFFHWWSRGSIGVFSPTSISNACGGGVICIGVIFCFSWHRRLGRSPGPASSTASSNNSHPSATVACPCATILWLAATFLTTTNKKVIEFDMFDIYIHLIFEILVLIFYSIQYIRHWVKYSTVPVNIFLFASCPFLKIFSTPLSSLVLSSSSSSELSMKLTPQPPYLSHTTIWCPPAWHPQPTMLNYHYYTNICPTCST